MTKNTNLHNAKRGSSEYVRRSLPASSTRGSLILVEGAAMDVSARIRQKIYASAITTSVISVIRDRGRQYNGERQQ